MLLKQQLLLSGLNIPRCDLLYVIDLPNPFRGPWASPAAQLVKNLPAMRKTWVRSLDWEDPLEEGMAAHSTILAWRIPMDREAWQAAVHEVRKSRT